MATKIYPGITLNLFIMLERIEIFIMLSLPICKPDMSPLFKSSLIFVLAFIIFTMNIIYIFCWFFYENTFFFFWATICSTLISVYTCSLLLYRNDLDIYESILYSTTLLSSLIILSFSKFLWIFYVENHIIFNRNTFISSF